MTFTDYSWATYILPAVSLQHVVVTRMLCVFLGRKIVIIDFVIFSFSGSFFMTKQK